MSSTRVAGYDIFLLENVRGNSVLLCSFVLVGHKGGELLILHLYRYIALNSVWSTQFWSVLHSHTFQLNPHFPIPSAWDVGGFAKSAVFTSVKPSHCSHKWSRSHAFWLQYLLEWKKTGWQLIEASKRFILQKSLPDSVSSWAPLSWLLAAHIHYRLLKVI